MFLPFHWRGLCSRWEDWKKRKEHPPWSWARSTIPLTARRGRAPSTRAPLLSLLVPFRLSVPATRLGVAFAWRPTATSRLPARLALLRRPTSWPTPPASFAPTFGRRTPTLGRRAPTAFPTAVLTPTALLPFVARARAIAFRAASAPSPFIFLAPFAGSMGLRVLFGAVRCIIVSMFLWATFATVMIPIVVVVVVVYFIRATSSIFVFVSGFFGIIVAFWIWAIAGETCTEMIGVIPSAGVEKNQRLHAFETLLSAEHKIIVFLNFRRKRFDVVTYKPPISLSFHEQFQTYPTASPEILHHPTRRRIWLFIAYSGERQLCMCVCMRVFMDVNECVYVRCTHMWIPACVYTCLCVWLCVNINVKIIDISIYIAIISFTMCLYFSIYLYLYITFSIHFITGPQ